MHTVTIIDSEDVSPEALALQRAVSIVGSQSALGRLLGRNQSTVHDWLKFRKALPAEHVLKVEAETGISRHELRPDLYPYESAVEARRPDHGLGDNEPVRREAQ